MKRSLRNGLLGLLMAPLVPIAYAAISPAEEKPLDTVVVEGTRAQLNDMLQELVKAEDRFFERYNELNTNDEFDMHCEMQARIGTAIRRRSCRAVYMDKAFESEGRDHVIARGNMYEPGAGTGRVLPWSPPQPPTMMIEAFRKDYQQNMRDVVSRNPELIRMLRERYELEKRYEETRRRAWGLKPLPEGERTAP